MSLAGLAVVGSSPLRVTICSHDRGDSAPQRFDGSPRPHAWLSRHLHESHRLRLLWLIIPESGFFVLELTSVGGCTLRASTPPSRPRQEPLTHRYARSLLMLPRCDSSDIEDAGNAMPWHSVEVRIRCASRLRHAYLPMSVNRLWVGNFMFSLQPSSCDATGLSSTLTW